MNDYRMVSCDFHDQIEALATLSQPCQIIYHDASDKKVEVRDQIVDVYAANKADFLKLKNGTEIRLDRIVSVNGNPVEY